VVHSEGGGGAIIHHSEGQRVHGVVYRLTRSQIEAMDRNELEQDHDPERRATRRTVTLHCPRGPLEAEIYLVPRPRTYEPPSEEYLAHIVNGLRSVGYEESVIGEVQGAAVSSAQPSGSSEAPSRGGGRGRVS
jgi:hypothetical protein